MPGMRHATHTISNSSTFAGWMESVGLDDFIRDPCSCIFGGEEEPIPIPGMIKHLVAAAAKTNFTLTGQKGLFKNIFYVQFLSLCVVSYFIIIQRYNVYDFTFLTFFYWLAIDLCFRFLNKLFSFIHYVFCTFCFCNTSYSYSMRDITENRRYLLFFNTVL